MDGTSIPAWERDRPPSPPSPLGGRIVCRLPPELAQPHKVTSILFRPLPAPLPACGFISIWTDGRGGPSVRCFPSAGAAGRHGHLLPPPPPPTSGGNSKAPENISARIQTTCWLPEQGYPGSREDRSCIVPGPETCLPNSGWDS